MEKERYFRMLFVFAVMTLICFAGPCLATFQADPAFQGKLCSPTTLDFGNVVSRLACAVRCEQHQACFGFFHSMSRKSCLGVDYFLMSSIGCSTIGNHNTFKFYRKTAATTTTATTTTTTTTAPAPSYGTSCSTNADCGAPNTGCLGSTCQCTNGYKLDPGTSTCVTGCSSYGSTFIKVPGYYLLTTHIGSYTGVTEAQCLVHCTNTATCVSLNYVTGSNDCYLKSKTRLEDPAATWASDSSINHYTRNCA